MMRSNAVPLVLAGLVFVAAGCQESSTTSSSGTATTATATETGAVAETPPAPEASGNPAPTDLLSADKSLEVALPGDRTSTLHYTDLRVGDGSIAGPGQLAMVHYTGWLADGSKFDSSVDRGQPFPFRIGTVPPGVIEGWDKGVRGMRVGGKRKLVIPPELGYGPRGYPPVIPPNATLIFEVELLGLKKE